MSEHSEIVEKLRKISNFAFDEYGELLPVWKQKELQDDAKSWIGELANKPFIVSVSTENLNIPELKNMPLILTRGAIKHIWHKHAQDFTFDELIDVLQNIRSEIERNVLAFQEITEDNANERICFVIDKLSRNKNDLMAVVEADCDSGSININKIITVHGKDELFEKIQESIEAKKNIYTNKRTGKWLAHTEICIFNGKSDSIANARSATRNYLLELYCKQNNVNLQDFLKTISDISEKETPKQSQTNRAIDRANAASAAQPSNDTHDVKTHGGQGDNGAI